MFKTKKYLLFVICAGMVIFAGCKKDKDDKDDNTNPTPTPTPVTVNSAPQVTGKMDGVDFKWLTGGLNPFVSVLFNDSQIALPPDSCVSILGSGFEKLTTGDYVFGIDMGTYKYVMPSDSVTLKNFFAIKSWPYSPTAVNGVKIEYIDSNGDAWRTNQGSANQTGSTFLLQDRRFFQFQGENYIRIKASFNCKLYNDVGAVKLLTNCVIVTDFWPEY